MGKHPSQLNSRIVRSLFLLSLATAKNSLLNFTLHSLIATKIIAPRFSVVLFLEPKSKVFRRILSVPV